MIDKVIVVFLILTSVLAQSQPQYPWYVQQQQKLSPATSWTDELIKDPHPDVTSPFAPFNAFADRRAYQPRQGNTVGFVWENSVDTGESPTEVDWEVTYQKSIQNQITGILGLLLRAFKRFANVFNPFTLKNRGQLLIDSITSVRTAYRMLRELLRTVPHVLSFLLRNGVASTILRAIIIFVPAVTKGLGTFFVNLFYFMRA